MQEVIYARGKSEDNAQELKDYIGIKIPLRSPVYLFYLVEDVNNPDVDRIFIVGYVMKAQGEAFWGYMMKDGNGIVIDGACNYVANLLIEFSKQWKENGYLLSAGFNEDKVSIRTNHFFDNSDDFEKYLEYNCALALCLNEIAEDEIPRRLNKNNIFKTLKSIELDPESHLYKVVVKELNTIHLTNHPKNIKNEYSYERLKAWLALYKGTITEKQFSKLHPFPQTLELFNQALYEIHQFPYPEKDNIEESVEESGDFWFDYQKETKNLMDKLERNIKYYEEGLNILDSKTNFEIVEKLTKSFFQALESRKIVLSGYSKGPCPKLSECSDPEANQLCQLYHYPKGVYRDHLN